MTGVAGRERRQDRDRLGFPRGMNPFTPTVGISPPLLVGRDGDLEDFPGRHPRGPGSPERATPVTGLRGTGKTVMLNAYEDLAKSEGWVVISETATPNLIDRITHEHLPELLQDADPRQTESHLTSVSLPGGSARAETSPTGTPRGQTCGPSCHTWPTFSEHRAVGCSSLSTR